MRAHHRTRLCGVATWIAAVILGAGWPAGAVGQPPAMEQQVQAPPQVWGGFRLAAAEHDAALRIGGLLQGDGIFLLRDRTQQADRFEMRRVRLSLKGTWGRLLAARIQPQWTSTGVEILDAYVDVRIIAGLSLRIGKQKTPLGLEMLRPAAALGLPERGFATSLLPSRDIGVQVSGDLWDGLLTYAVGGYNGVASGGKSNGNLGDDFDVAGRLFIQPFHGTSWGPLRALGLGLAGSWGIERGDASETGLGRFRTVARDVFLTFADGVAADGQRWRVNPQVWWFWGPLGILGEFVHASRQVRGDGSLHGVAQQAWTAEVGYVLTQEAAEYRGVTPKRRWGALQLVAQVGELKTPKMAFHNGMMDPRGPGDALSWGGALHYWAAVPLMAEVAFIRTTFEGGAGTGRPPENALFTRVQASF